MQAVLWKWLWRFAAAVIVLTVILSLVTGAVLRHVEPHAKAGVPGWLGGVLSLMAVLVVGGGMLPAFQREMTAVRERRHPPR